MRTWQEIEDDKRASRSMAEGFAKRREQETLNEQQFADYVGRAEDDLLHWKTRAEKAEAEVERLRGALKRIADAPAWGAPDRWETTPAEVRQLARAALEDKP